MLCTCETGLERKCRHQATEILQHYYEREREVGERKSLYQGRNGLGDSDDDNNSKDDNDGAAESGRQGFDAVTKTPKGGSEINKAAKLTLEEELEMLRKWGRQQKPSGSLPSEADDFPFHVRDTKCRGTVILLCTSPDRFLVASSSFPSPSTPSSRKVPRLGSGVACYQDNRDVAGADADAESEPLAGRGVSNVVIDPSLEDDASFSPPTDCGQNDAASGSAIQKPDASTLPENTTTAGCRPWDPVSTVLAVVRDLRESARRDEGEAGTAGPFLLTPSSSRSTRIVTPSSRFVTRMIPLQITCYASVDEIGETFRSLLRWYLRSSSSFSSASPAPSQLGLRDSYRQEVVPSPEASTTGNECGTMTGSDEANAVTNAMASPPRSAETRATTYMVHSKRRHCDNIRSQQVIDCVASLTPSHWKVDLKNPDVVVWVEICATLAGLSIVPFPLLQEAFQFNLLQARTSAVAPIEKEP
jgi:tRNA(Ser,Leu) C12 N-acetylase TAN1